MERISNVIPMIERKLNLDQKLSDSLNCSICSDIGFKTVGGGVRLCDCRLDSIRSAAIKKIPLAFRDFRLETVQAKTREQGPLIAAMRAEPHGSFFLAGTFGCGKSLLMWALYRHVLEEGNRRVVACTLTELLNEYKAFIQAAKHDADPIPPQLRADELRQDHTRYSIFLDDIDKARPTEYTAEVLFEIANAIYDFNHQLVVTTNLSVNSLTEHFNRADPRYGGAIVRRLVDGAKICEMF